MGGSLQVDSSLGKGSTFTFEIPLPLCEPTEACARAASAPAAAKDSSAAPSDARQVVRRRRVLLVEDNAVNQAIARIWLERFGCDVDCALNGRAALELGSHRRYDGIFMDCQMPEMDGYEATAEFRRREPQGRRTRIVAMTAHAMQGERERCLLAGMDEFLTKPVDKLALRQVIESLPFDAALETQGIHST
jgi:CheY-like chemotaxis protein